MLLLCALVGSITSGWAAEGDTHDFTQNLEQLLNNNASIDDIDIAAQSYPVKEVIVSYRYNKTIADAVTVDVSVGSTSFGTFKVNGTNKNYSTHSFTGTQTIGAVKISFTNNAGDGTGKGTFYVNKVTLVEGSSADPGKTDVTLSFPEDEYQADLKNGVNSFSAPQLTKSADVTVNYISTEEGVATVDASTGVVTLVGKGTTTIRASFAGDATYNNASAAYDLTVVDTKIYTIAEAKDIIDNGTAAAKNDVYVEGRISQIDDVNTTSGKRYATYWISANGMTSGAQMKVIQGKYTGNTDFTSTDQIAVGDAVVIYGNLALYSGSTYAFASGNYIVSRTPDTRNTADLAWSEDEVEIDMNAASYSLPTLTNPHNLIVSYTITGTEGLVAEAAGVITVDTSKEGTATVTAVFDGNDDYKAASVSYTVKVIDKNKKGSIYNPYTVADIIALNPTNTSTAKATDVYVKGYIAGCVNTSTGALITSDCSDTNLALVDNPDNTDEHISVQLATGTFRTNYNAKDHPELIGTIQILIKADVFKYCGVPGLKNLDEVSVVSERVKVTSIGLATFASNNKLDFTNVENLEAYIAKENGDKVELTKVNKVAAGTGVLLRAKNDATTFEVPVTTEDADDATGNLFVRGEGAAVATTDGSYTNYILSTKGGVVGFYHANNNIVAVNRAYLHTSVSAARIDLSFDELTGINEVKNQKEAVEGIFDLQGRKVAQPAKGLYIVNGKKVVIK